MLYLDDISARQFWRSLEDPRLILGNCSTTNVLRGCPKNAKQLRRQLAEVPDWLPVHMMVGEENERVLKDELACSLHCGALPHGSFYHVQDAICVASPELMFVQAGRYMSLPELVKLGDELCGVYSPARHLGGEHVERDIPLTDISSLRSFISQANRVCGVKMARRALQHLMEGSASAMETELVMLLCMPKRHGGFGLPSPRMNYRIDFDKSAAQIAGASYAKADLCWPEAKLDVEYDSDQWHSSIESVSHDKARANALSRMGYKVIFVTNKQLSSTCAFESIVELIAKNIRWRLRTPTAEELEKRAQLRHALDSSRRSPDFACRLPY